MGGLKIKRVFPQINLGPKRVWIQKDFGKRKICELEKDWAKLTMSPYIYIFLLPNIRSTRSE